MNIEGREMLRPVKATKLDAHNGIRHGFFTREGGVSGGMYRGLNAGIGSSDRREHVLENRARICRWLGVSENNLAGVYQVHSADVVTVEAAPGSNRPKADAMVTQKPGIALGVLTADCGPVLFSDASAGVIGAAHAGWKGALTGILDNTVTAMVALGAKRENITAILGPSIGKQNYEVGPEFIARFVDANADNTRWFSASPRAGGQHALFDLAGYTVDRLISLGVNAAATGECTYADEARFFSYRRTTHRGEPDYGRQMSAIVLEA